MEMKWLWWEYPYRLEIEWSMLTFYMKVWRSNFSNSNWRDWNDLSFRVRDKLWKRNSWKYELEIKLLSNVLINKFDYISKFSTQMKLNNWNSWIGLNPCWTTDFALLIGIAENFNFMPNEKKTSFVYVLTVQRAYGVRPSTWLHYGP